MDKNTTKENNTFFSPINLLNQNNNSQQGISYENFINAKNSNDINKTQLNNNNAINRKNKPFLFNMNPLYFNMFRFNSFNYTMPYNNRLFPNTRINSLLTDFNNELKEEYEKKEKINTQKNNDNKGNIKKEYDFTPLIKKLESQEDERFQKSRFLKFIKDINSKKLIINEEKNIIEENPNYIKENQEENNNNINELEALLKEAKLYMDYSREDLAINILEKIFDNYLIKLEKNKKYLIKAYIYIIICYLNTNEILLGISSINSLLNLIKPKEENNMYNLNYNKKYIDKEFIEKINRRDFDILNKEEYDQYECNKKKIKEETENYIKNIIMTNNKEEYNETLLLLYGLILYLNEKYNEAEEAFNQLIILNEQNYFYLNTLGVINASQNKYDEAIKYYNKALELNDKYPKCLINLGNLLLNKGKYKESCKYIITALKIYEDIPEGWNYLLSNVIEFDEDDELISDINQRNILNLENKLFKN